MPESAKSFFDNLWLMPANFWARVFVVIVALLVLGVVLRKIIQISHVVLAVALVAVGGIVFVKWVRERNEPAFMTPVVSFVASFFQESEGARK